MTTTQAVKGHPEKYVMFTFLEWKIGFLPELIRQPYFSTFPFPSSDLSDDYSIGFLELRLVTALAELWCLHFNEPANSLTPAAFPYLKARGGMRWNFTWDRPAVVSSTNSNMYSPV